MKESGRLAVHLQQVKVKGEGNLVCDKQISTTKVNILLSYHSWQRWQARNNNDWKMKLFLDSNEFFRQSLLVFHFGNISKNSVFTTNYMDFRVTKHYYHGMTAVQNTSMKF